MRLGDYFSEHFLGTRLIDIVFAEPFAETFPFRIQEISTRPDAGPERWIAGFTGTIDTMKGGFCFGGYFCGLDGVLKILRSMRTTHMRLLLGQLFGFLYITIEFAIGGEEMIGTAIGFTVGALGDYGIEFASQRAVAALVEAHGWGSMQWAVVSRQPKAKAETNKAEI